MNWEWLWFLIPCLAGGVWWLILHRRERKADCWWCGARAGDTHAPGCRVEARK